MVETERPTTSGGKGTSGTVTRRGSDTSAVNASSAGQHSTESTRRRPHAVQTDTTYGSITSSAGRNAIVSPDRVAPKTKKPSLSRRTTSAHLPYKGQEFSVDDAEEEVTQDWTEQQKQQQMQEQKQKLAKPSVSRNPTSTMRRRPTAQPPPLPTVESHEDDDTAQGSSSGTLADNVAGASTALDGSVSVEEEVSSENRGDDDDDADLSDAESFTLKDRQDAINVTHPFGIRIWKPALYKKDRSVRRNAEGDIHSTPGLLVSNWLFIFNIAWTLVFGLPLALVAAAGGLLCALFGFFDSCLEYSRLLFHLAGYLFHPFGKYVKLMQDEAYAEEDEGEGRSISEYEQWQSGDIEEGRLFFGPNNHTLIGQRRNSIESTDETTSLLGRDGRATLTHSDTARTKRRLFGRGKWNVGRVIFFIFFYGLFTPAIFLVCGLCYFFVFTIPMGKTTMLLFDHLRRHPLALSFHSDSGSVRRSGESSSILLCTYRAVGLRYWKYTIDGTNIFFINLLGLVAFTIFDYYVLSETLHLKIWLTDQMFVFILSLASIIPLAYFIGQAVASISAQSSMGVGATINAFFSTVVEVFLYCVALDEGKAQLVEGSIIGSIFAGILFLPGLSMCFGALKRKTQRFNVKSAGVTSTMLLFAVIGAFGPTLFYQIYGSHELNCHQCIRNNWAPDERDCRRCYYSQTPAVNDRFYKEAIQPYIWFAAVMLFLSYVIGLLFTLRTHAAVIWTSELDEKKIDKVDMSASGLSASAHTDHPFNLTRQATNQSLNRADIRDSPLYKRILGQSYKQVGLGPNGEPHPSRPSSSGNDGQTPHVVPPKDVDEEHNTTAGVHMHGLSEDMNSALVRHIAEISATAATVAARDSIRAPRKASYLANHAAKSNTDRAPGQRHTEEQEEAAGGHASGGHDAPNWSRTKSAVILLIATIAYAVIAEILVNTVDAVLEGSDIDEKFLGITLFALVPNTTEFLNAISFAMNGNIALSMEIGSAYALQVCLLQIPALVFYSALQTRFVTAPEILKHTFTLIFPQWDMVTVIMCVFLLSYMYGEGKSNYFKGSILILSYFVVVVGFYFSSYSEDYEMMGVDRSDTLALGGFMQQQFQSMSFKTKGRARQGEAF